MTQLTENQNKSHNTKIYKLEHLESGFFYVGSTIQALSKRPACHKKDAVREPTPAHKKLTSFDGMVLKLF